MAKKLFNARELLLSILSIIFIVQNPGARSALLLCKRSFFLDLHWVSSFFSGLHACKEVWEEDLLADIGEFNEEVSQQVVVRLYVCLERFSFALLDPQVIFDDLRLQVQLALLKVVSETLQGWLFPPSLEHHARLGGDHGRGTSLGLAEQRANRCSSF